MPSIFRAFNPLLNPPVPKLGMSGLPGWIPERGESTPIHQPDIAPESIPIYEGNNAPEYIPIHQGDNTSESVPIFNPADWGISPLNIFSTGAGELPEDIDSTRARIEYVEKLRHLYPEAADQHLADLRAHLENLTNKAKGA